MIDFRVTSRATCKCGSTEVSTTVLVQLTAGEDQPNLHPPPVPEIVCVVCDGPTDQPTMRK